MQLDPYQAVREGVMPVAPLIADFLAVPAIEIDRDTLDRRLVVGFNSRDSRARPFTLMRTQLRKALLPNRWRMIGITSATPAAGKTFTAVNLAAALSMIDGQRIVLCDFDLRRGSILEMLEVSCEKGLGQYLEGKVADPAELPFRISDTSLTIVPTNITTLSSSELLGTQQFSDLIARLRAQDENTIVICDLPPVFANDDAMLCMQHLDGYLLVIEHGRTTKRQVEEAIALLRPAPCIGTVLNRYNGGFGDDYGYGYGDAYGLRDYGG